MGIIWVHSILLSSLIWLSILKEVEESLKHITTRYRDRINNSYTYTYLPILCCYIVIVSFRNINSFDHAVSASSWNVSHFRAHMHPHVDQTSFHCFSTVIILRKSDGLKKPAWRWRRVFVLPVIFRTLGLFIYANVDVEDQGKHLSWNGTRCVINEPITTSVARRNKQITNS